MGRTVPLSRCPQVFPEGNQQQALAVQMDHPDCVDGVAHVDEEMGRHPIWQVGCRLLQPSRFLSEGFPDGGPQGSSRLWGHVVHPLVEALPFRSELLLRLPAASDGLGGVPLGVRPLRRGLSGIQGGMFRCGPPRLGGSPRRGPGVWARGACV